MNQMALYEKDWLVELESFLKQTHKWDKLVVVTDLCEITGSCLHELLKYVLETPLSRLPIDY